MWCACRSMRLGSSGMTRAAYFCLSSRFCFRLTQAFSRPPWNIESSSLVPISQTSPSFGSRELGFTPETCYFFVRSVSSSASFLALERVVTANTNESFRDWFSTFRKRQSSSATSVPRRTSIGRVLHTAASV